MTSPQVVQTGIFDLVAQAGLVGKMVLLLLLSVSVFSWAVIITKYRSLKGAMVENTNFLNAFWHGKSIEEIFINSDKFPRSPVAQVFKSGVKELKKLPGTETNAIEAYGMENIGRALGRASNAEVAHLEKNIGWLATVASASPFLGLFGTVWGIMNSFQNIGAAGAANLAVVAPGISEALITTATGIGAAIPAVIAYNYFAGQIKKVAIDMDCFSQDFLNIIQRSAITQRKGG